MVFYCSKILFPKLCPLEHSSEMVKDQKCSLIDSEKVILHISVSCSLRSLAVKKCYMNFIIMSHFICID